MGTQPDPLARHRRVSVAPMLDWTDRHCRYFHRLLTSQALLYTEMVTTGALLHGDTARHLQFHAHEQPVALQLGGSDPNDLARCARLAQSWGYAEVNLNCGCPSSRVQRGAFGACLMHEPVLVADCVKAMCDVVAVPVTVKHRIGIDHNESYEFVRDFVGRVHEAGCGVFIVHGRNAWLNGLSPKQNREIPPLRPSIVYRLKVDFPGLHISYNGGVQSPEEIEAHLRHVDGVMVGRAAYQQPWLMADWDRRFFGMDGSAVTRESVEEAMVAYMLQERAASGTAVLAIARHMLGLRHGLPGARGWRQVWSDHRLRDASPVDIMLRASAGRRTSIDQNQLALDRT